MSLKKIISILRHPTSIKVISFLVIVGFFFILPVFAQVETKNTYLGKVTDNLNTILNFCSRGWVILSILAGKLMTNDWVYGSIIHMDIYLWKIWNIMKNFANFGLIAIVLRNIVKNLIGQEKMDVKKIIIKTLIAGVLIQASWFLVGALVDLSTIATAAVGSFPSQFLHNDTDLNESIQNKIRKTPRKYTINLSTGAGLTTEDTASNEEGAKMRDEILPTSNSVSGPLFYLGFSVFKFQAYMNTAGGDGAAQLTMAFLLRAMLVIFFTLTVGLLFIANAIRVAFLRIFIIASPIIILSQVFFDDKGLNGGGKGLGQYLSFGIMIDLILKPIIFVAGFSMILIFVVSIQKIMNAEIPPTFNGVTINISSGASRLNVGDIADIQVKESKILGGDVNDTTGSTITDVSQTVFVNLILFFLTTFLMWQFVKISVTSGKGPVSDAMKSLTGTIEGAMKNLPIIPLGGGASMTSLKYAREQNFKNIMHGMNLNESGQFGEYKDKQFTTQQEKFREFISGKVDWKDSDYTNLSETARTAPTSFLTNSSSIASKAGLSLSTNSKRWTTLREAIKDNPSARNSILGSDATEPTADQKSKGYEEYFKAQSPKVLRTLYTGLKTSSTPDKTLTEGLTRDQLKSVNFKKAE